MDVYGRKPKSEKGKYFRNNIWWWRPLWNFCEQVAPDLIPEDNHGHSNDGWGLNCSKSLELAERLTDLLDSGQVKMYEEDYKRAIESIPLETCTICDGTGKRKMEPRKGETCNGCGGKGKRESYEAGYPFEEENVKEFRDFLLDCGGFQIC